jgi:hypothetical protein
MTDSSLSLIISCSKLSSITTICPSTKGTMVSFPMRYLNESLGTWNRNKFRELLIIYLGDASTYKAYITQNISDANSKKQGDVKYFFLILTKYIKNMLSWIRINLS